MKTISLLQPWAHLIVIGAKTWETRSFKRSYRGPILIHASLNKSHARKLIKEWPFNEYIESIDELSFGKIIGATEIQKITTTEEWIITHQELETERNQEEYRFGDYSEGRYAWKLRNPVRFDHPVPAKGQLNTPWEFEWITDIQPSDRDKIKSYFGLDINKHLRLRPGIINQSAWDEAFSRTFEDTSKSQYEYYMEIIREKQ